MTGAEDGSPYKVGVALVDVLAGLHAAAGILAALNGGEGGRIEVPLLDSGLAGLVNVAQNALITGLDPERHRERASEHRAVPGLRDGVRPAGGGGGERRALPRPLPRDRLDELAGDERYATNAGRVEHRTELVAQLARRFHERSSAEWVAVLDAAGVPVGQGALGSRRARGGGGGRPAGDRAGGSIRAAGELELVASPIWTDGAVDAASAPPLSVSTPPRCCVSWAAPTARSRRWPSADRTTRLAEARGSAACARTGQPSAVSAVRRSSTPAGATPRRAM